MTPTLLCIHGAGLTSRIFEKQRRVFSGVRAPNLPGHDSPGQAASIDEFADFIEDYVRNERLSDIVVCGHSLGGAIALQLALRHLPQVRGLVLFGSGARLRVSAALLQDLERNFETTAQTISGLLYADQNSPLLAQARDSLIKVGRAQTLRDFRACDAFDVTAQLKEIDSPVLAVTGRQDRMTPPKYAHALAAGVADGSVTIIDNAGHMVMQEHPAEANAALKNFVTMLQSRDH